MSDKDTEKYLIDKLLDIQEKHLDALSNLYKEMARKEDLSSFSQAFELYQKDFFALKDFLKDRENLLDSSIVAIQDSVGKREKAFDEAIKDIKERDNSLRNLTWVISSIQTVLVLIATALIVFFKKGAP